MKTGDFLDAVLGPEDQTCAACGMVRGDNNDGRWCFACNASIPAALRKAVDDPFDYALRLATGEIIFFESAVIDGEWVHLNIHPPDFHAGLTPDRTLPFSFERGVDVRLSDIVWCADAPNGS